MVSVALGLFVIVGHRLIMMPSVYSSIYRAGDRVGAVLPFGFNERSHHSHDARLNPVVLERSTFVPVYTQGQTPPNTDSAGLGMASIDLVVPLLLGTVYLAVLFLVTTISLWRHTPFDFRRVSNRQFIWVLTMGSGVCIALGTLFSASRIFWTGVDQAFSSRSITQVLGSSVIRIRGNQLLAMSNSELMMMLIAMIMTAVPILFYIDLKLFRRVPREIDPGLANGRMTSMLSRIYEHELMQRHFTGRSLSRVGGVCYGLVALFLWTSPWSTTILRAAFH